MVSDKVDKDSLLWNQIVSKLLESDREQLSRSMIIFGFSMAVITIGWLMAVIYILSKMI